MIAYVFVGLAVIVDDHPQNPDEIFEQLRQAAGVRSAEEPLPPAVSVLARMTHVKHVPEQQMFTVEGTDGSVHACRLFPKESCTCPANTTCCHITAAKRSIGLDVDKRRVINLSELRKNARYNS